MLRAGSDYPLYPDIVDDMLECGVLKEGDELTKLMIEDRKQINAVRQALDQRTDDDNNNDNNMNNNNANNNNMNNNNANNNNINNNNANNNNINNNNANNNNINNNNANNDTVHKIFHQNVPKINIPRPIHSKGVQFCMIHFCKISQNLIKFLKLFAHGKNIQPSISPSESPTSDVQTTDDSENEKVTFSHLCRFQIV